MKNGGYMCHIISNAKDQLKHMFPYINYKKRKGAFLASMHRDCLVISKKKTSEHFTIFILYYSHYYYLFIKCKPFLAVKIYSSHHLCPLLT